MPVPLLVLVRVIPLLVLAASAVVTTGCFDPGDEARVFVNGTAIATPAPAVPSSASTTSVAALAFTPTPFASDLDPANLTGFAFPIAGACLPSRDEVMPNSPRPYRNGVHEGVDFYHGDVCTTIEPGTPVLAMYDGVVTRADLDYVDITLEQVEALEAKTTAQGFSDPATLDAYRGRQVWIDHGNGIVSRYGHLSAIVEGLGVAVEVQAGQVIGAVGESGTPESLTAPGTELHLHAEVRVGDGFLGEGHDAAEVRRLYARLFGDIADGAAPPSPPEVTPVVGPEAETDPEAAETSEAGEGGDDSGADAAAEGDDQAAAPAENADGTSDESAADQSTADETTEDAGAAD